MRVQLLFHLKKQSTPLRHFLARKYFRWSTMEFTFFHGMKGFAGTFFEIRNIIGIEKKSESSTGFPFLFDRSRFLSLPYFLNLEKQVFKVY